MISWLSRTDALVLGALLALIVVAAKAGGGLSAGHMIGMAIGTTVYLVGCRLGHAAESEAATDGGRNTESDVTIAGGDRNRRQTTSEGN